MGAVNSRNVSGGIHHGSLTSSETGIGNSKPLCERGITELGDASSADMISTSLDFEEVEGREGLDYIYCCNFNGLRIPRPAPICGLATLSYILRFWPMNFICLFIQTANTLYQP